MLDPASTTTHLDTIEKIVHIFGIPAIFAGIVWVIRTFDAGARKLKDIDGNSKAAFDTAAVIKAQVDTLQNNHMAHMAVELRDQTTLLINMDKNIGIIADRSPRHEV